jgi:hypothetical protein
MLMTTHPFFYASSKSALLRCPERATDASGVAGNCDLQAKGTAADNELDEGTQRETLRGTPRRVRVSSVCPVRAAS